MASNRPDVTKYANVTECIKEAAWYDDLDDAAWIVQEYIGVCEGFQASMFFSDLEDGEWLAMSLLEREGVLLRYARSELDGLEDYAAMRQKEPHVFGAMKHVPDLTALGVQSA